MRKVIYALSLGLISAACSSPKYTYHFDHYDYNSGKKNNVAAVTSASADVQVHEASPLIIEQQQVVATTERSAPAPSLSSEQKQTIAQKIKTMSKAERNELKQVLKKEIKATKKKNVEGQSVNAKQEWDRDLKLAAIFGAVGIVLTALGGVSSVFYVLGVIALVVGVVFLIKWLARQ